MEAKSQRNLINRIFVGCLISALGFALVNLLGDRIFSLKIAQIPLWQSILWSYLTGLLLIIVFIPVLLKSRWRGFTLFIGIWLPLYYIAYLSGGLIESYFFTTVPRSELWLISLNGMVATIVLTYLMIVVFAGKEKGTATKEKRALPAKRAWYAWVWRIALCAFIYLFLYFLAGGIFYQYFTKPLYTDPSLSLMPPESGADFFKWLVPLQLVRGALFALVLLPLCRSLKIRRAYLALLIGLILYIVGGFAPLIAPNPWLPDKLRFYHAIEIFFQNFPTGLAIAYILGAKKQS